MNTKYILTARNRVKKLDFDDTDDRIYYWHYKNNPFLADYEQEDIIVKEADNLEELIDVIVETKGHTGEYVHYMYSDYDRYLELKPKILDDMLTQDFEAYGAIWTDKGLIYVAKLNDKGELEIL